MELIRQPGEGIPLVRRYGNGSFTIGATRIDGAVLIGMTVEALSLPTFADITPDHMAKVAALQPRPEILLIGAGPAPATLTPDCRASLKDAGINVEVMATGAACRTFNVALGEGRRVAALLIPID
ncbi:MAG: hypothetical protein ACI82H_002022 [Alphaproteobacteria bacterium]|jgi:uncharacterized protein